MHNLKSLNKLKQQRAQEEQAFESLKKADARLASLTDDEVLHFFGLTKREEIVGYRVGVKRDTEATIERQSREMTCLCRDASGKEKLLYETYEEAEVQSVFLKRERQVNLKVYACSSTHGWHLSKS